MKTIPLHIYTKNKNEHLGTLFVNYYEMPQVNDIICFRSHVVTVQKRIYYFAEFSHEVTYVKLIVD